MPRPDSSHSLPKVVLTVQTLTIDGEAIPIEHKRMQLEEVQLDPSNPRIQHAVKQISGNGTISPEALRKLILESPGVPELFKLIRDNGGLHEPIYVRLDGRVIEGNCRAASYLKLHGIDPKDSRWQTIPAVFVPEISDRQVAILQGQYHIAGKNKWLAYEKAGHLHNMRTKLGMDEKAIGRALGMHESEVIKNLQSYEVMTEKLLPKVKHGNGLDKWSFVQELFKRKDLEEYRAKPANIDEFVSLVLNKKLKQGADVRKLGTILKHPNAVKTLKKQDADSAMAIVGKADPTADSGAFRKLKQTTTLLQRLPRKELERLRDSEKPQVILRDLFAAVRDVAKAAGIKLS
jgi:hypothetical protein